MTQSQIAVTPTNTLVRRNAPHITVGFCGKSKAGKTTMALAVMGELERRRKARGGK